MEQAIPDYSINSPHFVWPFHCPFYYIDIGSTNTFSSIGGDEQKTMNHQNSTPCHSVLYLLPTLYDT